MVQLGNRNRNSINYKYFILVKTWCAYSNQSPTSCTTSLGAKLLVEVRSGGCGSKKLHPCRGHIFLEGTGQPS